MLSDLELFYVNRNAEEQELLLFLRRYILDASIFISEHYKFKTAFFYLNGKMFCYLGQEKKSRQFYIGFVQGKQLSHPALVQGNRKQIKILPVSTHADVELQKLNEVVGEALNLSLSLQNLKRSNKSF
jgi:hypothetical protein